MVSYLYHNRKEICHKKERTGSFYDQRALQKHASGGQGMIPWTPGSRMVRAFGPSHSLMGNDNV